MKGLTPVYRIGKQLSDQIEKVLKILLVILAFGCALDVLLQVVYRFIIIRFVTLSLTWTNEMAQNLIVWMTYLAIGICYKENSMAAVNLVFDKLKPRPKLVLYFITRAIIVVFLFFSIKYGIASVQSVSNWKSPSMHLPGIFLYGAPVVGSVLIGVEVLVDLLGVMCGELVPFVCRQPEEEEEELTAEEIRTLAAMERELQAGKEE